MPTYDYECDACGHAFEHFQSMSSRKLRTCPSCGEKKLERLFGTGAGVIFKGSGFYETDYKRAGSPRPPEGGEGGEGGDGAAGTDGSAGAKAASADTSASSEKAAAKPASGGATGDQSGSKRASGAGKKPGQRG